MLLEDFGICFHSYSVKLMQAFVDTRNWNFHRIRRQARTYLLDGVSDHTYEIRIPVDL